MTNPLMEYLPYIGPSFAVLGIVLALWALRTSMKAQKAIEASLDRLQQSAKAWNRLRGGSQ